MTTFEERREHYLEAETREELEKLIHIAGMSGPFANQLRKLWEEKHANKEVVEEDSKDESAVDKKVQEPKEEVKDNQQNAAVEAAVNDALKNSR